MMKGLITIMLIAFALGVSAQRGSVYHYYDTLNGAETVNFTTISASGSYATLSLDVECTELGGTSDGTLILQGRNGSASEWTTLTSTYLATWGNFSPNDTLTITDGAVWKVELHDPGFLNYRVQGLGTSGDTTLVDIRWLVK